MIKGRVHRLVGLLVISVIVAGLVLLSMKLRLDVDASGNEKVDRCARLSPDYAGVTIPPNIAPMNFRVDEPGSLYEVRVSSARGREITVTSRSGDIVIPAEQWRRLVTENKGEDLVFDIRVEEREGRRVRYGSVTNFIARSDIDPYLVYRRIHANYHVLRDVGIYERHLESAETRTVLHGGSTYGRSLYKSGFTTCVNCHSFANGRTNAIGIAYRDPNFGAGQLLVREGKVERLATKFGYPAWHPSGKLIAYSMNDVRQVFYQARDEIRDAVDADSGIAYYLPHSNTVRIDPGISRKDRLETYPTWSPDGRFLYYCSAKQPWTLPATKIPPDGFEHLRYDIMRAEYDMAADTWSEPETVLAAVDVGKSLLAPRISPDGRFLVFCACDYGGFPIFHAESDLYVLDLDSIGQETQPRYRELGVNSDESEAWHCWSSNGRWLAFSSRREGGVFTRIYFAYVDSEGTAGKPFVLPQEDPGHDESFLYGYSLPELIREPVPVQEMDLVNAIRGGEPIEPDMPITGATPKVPPHQTHDPGRIE